jgi:RNA polymerase sigma factor (sigma-70 family)
MKSRGRAASQQLDLLFRAGSTAGLSDGELLRRIVSTDREVAAIAFETLVRQHGAMVLATCRGVLRNEHDAEDAFQATFLVLARRAGSLRDGDRLGPWLHRVALRASERARAEAARRRRHEAERAELAATEQSRPEWEAEREEMRYLIHREVDRLPERYRVVVVLCDLQSESYEASATRLGVPVGTIRSRLSRARERLRVQIGRRGLALPAGMVAALLASGKASAAVPPHLLASTVRMASLGDAVGLSVGSASTAAMTYAEGILKSGGPIGVGKAGVAASVVGVFIGLVGVGSGVLAPTNPHQPPAKAATAQPSSIDPATATRPDTERLQGRWVIAEAEQHGRPQALVVGDRLLIQGGRFEWTADRGEPVRIFFRGTTRGRIAVDPGADPHRLSLNESVRSIPVIYRLEDDGDGDRLRLCVGDPDAADWPRSFASEPESRQLLLVFQRADQSGRRAMSPNLQDSNKGKDNP